MKILNYLKTRPYLIHTIGIILLAIYIVFADTIFSNITQQGESPFENFSLSAASQETPILFDIAPIQKNKLEWKDVLTINGWAFIDNQNSNQNKIYLILTSTNKKIFFYSTTQYTAPDVADAYKAKKLDLKNSSFLANIPLEKLPNNTYSISIMIKDDRNQFHIKQIPSYFYKDNDKIIDNFISTQLN